MAHRRRGQLVLRQHCPANGHRVFHRRSAGRNGQLPTRDRYPSSVINFDTTMEFKRFGPKRNFQLAFHLDHVFVERRWTAIEIVLVGLNLARLDTIQANSHRTRQMMQKLKLSLKFLLVAFVFSIAGPLAAQTVMGSEQIRFENHHADKIERKIFPSVGLIYNDKFRRGEFGCSGVLVSPVLVLTAFHCINANGKITGNIEFQVHNGESSHASPLLYATAERLPRTMDVTLKIDEILSIQSEDLVLLKLIEPIFSVEAVSLFDFRENAFDEKMLVSVGYPSISEASASAQAKFQSVLKYKGAVASLLHLEGLIAPGMSGGGVFIETADGKQQLIAINGMTMATGELVAMAPYFYEAIRDEIVKSQKDFAREDVMVNLAVKTTSLKNQLVNAAGEFNKKAFIEALLQNNQGIDMICQLRKDPEIIRLIELDQIASADNKFRLAACLGSSNDGVINQYVLPRMRGPDKLIRSESFATISKYQVTNAMVLSALIESMHFDTDLDLRRQAYNTVVRLKFFDPAQYERKVDAIIKTATSEPEPELRIEARFLLEAMSEKDPALRKRMKKLGLFKF